MNTSTIKDIPENMRLIERSDTLEFVYSWFKPKYMITLLAVPVFVFYLIKSNYVSGSFDQPTIPVYLLLIIAAVILYYALAKVINKTTIHVTHDNIVVNHGPIPFLKNITLQKKDVSQLYVTRYRTGHRYYLYSDTFQINIILHSGEIDTLVRGLYSAEQCRFIERKIESFFNITDIKVDGELAKD